MGNKTRKPKYFIDLYEEMKRNPEKSFWESAPVQDTVFGKVASYVLFRCVGVDVAKYIHRRFFNGESLLEDEVKRIPTIDCVSVEFLHAWIYEPVMGDLQMEGLALRLLMDDKSFQLWLVEILSKIPVTQWNKVEKKFIATCGNVLYMAVYLAWLRVVQGSGGIGIQDKLPKDLTLLERYVLSRTLCGFELDEFCIERVNYYKTNAKKQESLTIWLGHSYRNNRFNAKLGYATQCVVSDEKSGYFEMISIFCGLWSESLQEILDDTEWVGNIETGDMYASAIGTLVGFNYKYIEHQQSVYISKFMKSKGSSVISTEASDTEVTLKKQVGELEAQLRQLTKRAEDTEEELGIQKRKLKETERGKEAVEKQRIEALNRADMLQRMLKEVEGKQATNKAAGVKEPERIQVLEKEIGVLSEKVEESLNRIEDLYMLLGSDTGMGDILEEEGSQEEAMDWEAAVASFKGRLILYSGYPDWQEQVCEWFENHGVKVRVYQTGEDIVNLRKTDFLFMNTLNNKHSYSGKHMYAARNAGARMVVYGANNLEVTLRLIFKKNQYKVK